MKNGNGIQIERFGDNPLIFPQDARQWMSVAVMNCSVNMTDDGRFKMLFRATGRPDHLESSLGFAFSDDGRRWVLSESPVLKSGSNQYCRLGVEDPRTVRWIDGYYYVFTTVLPNKNEKGLVIRLGIWRTKNFHDFEWVGMPFDEENKNAAIFPEPIGGFAYLLHRRGCRDIWISRTDDLTLRQGWRDSQVLIKKEAFYAHPENGSAPNKIGIAGPPVKTPKGWLSLVHVRHEPQMYTLGFMVLDRLDPTRVIYVHPEPILRPEMLYERLVGCVPNVVFSCATVDVNQDDLYVYWGGADTVINGGLIHKKNLPMCY